LPTEAEWNYAAAGGSEQRVYPWGSTAPGTNANLAVWGCYYNGSGTCTGPENIAPVGSIPAGNAKWGQADMGGNLNEWVQDLDDNPYTIVPCDDCAQLVSAAETRRQTRGGSYLVNSTPHLLTSYRLLTGVPSIFYSDDGVRCARAP
jgi:formylglycine-generating enzyme required for sulfatase activity